MQHKKFLASFLVLCHFSFLVPSASAFPVFPVVGLQSSVVSPVTIHHSRIAIHSPQSGAGIGAQMATIFAGGIHLPGATGWELLKTSLPTLLADLSSSGVQYFGNQLDWDPTADKRGIAEGV